ncbi:MAG TPA: type 4a pilus biogenesis protein PilO [Candidatus Acidoferrum sp.]|nr:type 4a pilus biogenesis protein PilO [Candidatus Acidoferrum sp.]
MKIQNRQQVLVLVVLGLIALWAGNLLVYGPMVKWWHARQDKIKELRQEVVQGKSLIRREAYIRSEWASMQTNSLPNNSSLAEQQVLKALNNWAGDTGINVSSVTPQWQMDQDDYSTLDCRVEASGDLNALSRFLYEIESDPMALQLATIQLTASDDRGQQLSLGLELSGLALISPQP